jgi:hypothetical protein
LFPNVVVHYFSLSQRERESTQRRRRGFVSLCASLKT